MQISANHWWGTGVVVGACALAFISGCTPKPHPSKGPDAVTLGAAVADPKRLGWSTEGVGAIRQHAGSLGSAALLIVTDGEVVLSYGDVARNFRAHSIRKSFLSALYGIAIENGRIDPAKTLAELSIDDKTPLTESEKQATIADLLAARSGIYLPAASEVASMRRGRPERHQHEPGTHWYYNNWDFNVLGSVYRQETGEDIFEAFQRQIAVAIGMQDYDLSDMRYQYEDMSIHPSYKFRISTRDLARFGLLYLNNGAWRGAQVIPTDWVKSSTRAHSITKGSGTKSGYGLMWWVVASSAGQPAISLLPRAYTASGTGGHRLTVLPDIGTVLVYRTDTDDPHASRIGSSTYDRFLTQVMQARLTTNVTIGPGNKTMQAAGGLGTGKAMISDVTLLER